MISNDNFLFETQVLICDILNNDSVLSSINFLPENAKDIDYQIKTNLSKQGIVGIVMTPKARFIGRNDKNELVWDLPELTVMITENTNVNRTSKTSFTGQDISIKVLDILGKQNYGKFSPIAYEQGEDSGLLVNKVTFSCTIIQNEKENEDININNNI